MITYQKISRWLSTSLDPIAIEDWIANREVFGPIEKPDESDLELEAAYRVENGEEHPDLLLLKVPGKELNVELTRNGKKTEKMKVGSGDFLTIVPEENGTKIKVRGKKDVVWEGSDKKKIIVEAL